MNHTDEETLEMLPSAREHRRARSLSTDATLRELGGPFPELPLSVTPEYDDADATVVVVDHEDVPSSPAIFPPKSRRRRSVAAIFSASSPMEMSRTLIDSRFGSREVPVEWKREMCPTPPQHEQGCPHRHSQSQHDLRIGTPIPGAGADEVPSLSMSSPAALPAALTARGPGETTSASPSRGERNHRLCWCCKPGATAPSRGGIGGRRRNRRVSLSEVNRGTLTPASPPNEKLSLSHLFTARRSMLASDPSSNSLRRMSWAEEDEDATFVSQSFIFSSPKMQAASPRGSPSKLPRLDAL